MFYGPGAGAGPTASAVVGDLMEIMRSGRSYAVPKMEKSEDGVLDFGTFVCRSYIALSGITKDSVLRAFGSAQFIEGGEELAFITSKISEEACKNAISALEAEGARLMSRIRLL
jgi:hypothetical protein